MGTIWTKQGPNRTPFGNSFGQSRSQRTKHLRHFATLCVQMRAWVNPLTTRISTRAPDRARSDHAAPVCVCACLRLGYNSDNNESLQHCAITSWGNCCALWMSSGDATQVPSVNRALHSPAASSLAPLAHPTAKHDARCMPHTSTVYDLRLHLS